MEYFKLQGILKYKGFFINFDLIYSNYLVVIYPLHFPIFLKDHTYLLLHCFACKLPKELKM